MTKGPKASFSSVFQLNPSDFRSLGLYGVLMSILSVAYFAVREGRAGGRHWHCQRHQWLLVDAYEDASIAAPWPP